MKKILFQSAMTAMVLTLVCSCGRAKELSEAEASALDDPDRAAVLLAQVDTVRLRASSRALYHLTRALIDEERWQRQHADTASCLTATDDEWKFFVDTRVGDRHLTDGGYKVPAALYETFKYYERASLGGTAGDRTALRRFGRICYVLGQHFSDQDSLLQGDQLLHLAIHCAEAADDHATAYRAYDMMGRHQDYAHNDMSSHYWCTLQALEHFDQRRDHPLWLLMLVNDYGHAFLKKSGVNPTLFPLLARAAAMTADHRQSPMTPAEYDAVFQLIDSVRNAPADVSFAYPRINSTGAFSNDKGEPYYKWQTEVAVPIPMYEEAREMAEKKGEYLAHPGWAFKYDIDVAVSRFQSQQRTYLAPGYVLKASMLQRRLLMAVITILVLALVLLVILFRNSRQQMRRRHEDEQAERRREAERLAEQLRQKDALIAVLRGHIIDKSEILEMLAPKEGKRTLINARNWREIEMTLDMADNFVGRLRSEHPDFSEDDIRLCMLTRLRLSNTALSAIYVISVSAVQHRKQKLKKEGFGVIDPTVTLDQLIANY
ncbi:MAG: hypothetical protein K6B45_09630 [Bacteroidaceae bacterium]|nr:hypothetical protein [Bacteroidaceae bacterium]